MNQMSILEAAAHVLKLGGRPLHAREIVSEIVNQNLAQLSGATPWKTVTSKISMDIRSNEATSRFLRVGQARFALREWNVDTEFLVNKRKINPFDESIKVVNIAIFKNILGKKKSNNFFNINIERLIEASIAIKRQEAEQSESFVQIIPTFIVRKGKNILTYRRTRRLPESRLHNIRCVSFGGHMQSEDDSPDLFARSIIDVNNMIFRELYEELHINEPFNPKFKGALYLENSLFERQHVGLIFDINISKQATVTSLEKSRHADVKYMNINDLLQIYNDLDSWSQVIVEAFQ